jgi:outer membrane protein
MRRLLPALLIACTAAAQSPMRLSLSEAEALAVRNNPALSVAQLTAQASGQVPLELRAGLLPTLYGSATAVGADNGSRIGAGALTNSVIYSRLGAGLTVSQLLTDFGRTKSLVEASKSHAAAEQQVAETVRAAIVFQTDGAYYALLRTRSLLTVAEQTVAARQLVAEQVAALAQASLKSQLDVSFANVNLAQAKLQLSGARNQLSSASAKLSSALGMTDEHDFELTDEALPGPLDSIADGYIRTAIEKRPELATLRLEVSAAERSVQAEKALAYPVVSVIGTAGFVPSGVIQVPGHYGAIGANISIPVFNGGLNKARRNEAELKLQAANRRVDDLNNRVVRDVRTAWLDASTAFEQVGLTAQLLEQATVALDLAKSRYELGLSAIVELSQAQLNLTSAQIATAGAKFDYLVQRSYLALQTGALR